MRSVPMASYPRRLAGLAAADPSRPAVTDEHRTVTRAELERLASDMAEPWMLADLIDERVKAGVKPEDIAVIAQSEMTGVTSSPSPVPTCIKPP